MVAYQTTPQIDSLVYDTARLRNLDRCGILDTEYEEAFDDIAHLASIVCRVPIAAIAFVDKSRFWLKAEVGLGVRELPLSPPICTYTLIEPTPYVDLVVVDNLCTRLQAQQGLQLAPQVSGIKFYAGALIRLNGCILGVLSVFDYTPRSLCERELQALVLLRDQITRELAKRTKRQEQGLAVSGRGSSKERLAAIAD